MGEIDFIDLVSCTGGSMALVIRIFHYFFESFETKIINEKIVFELFKFRIVNVIDCDN